MQINKVSSGANFGIALDKHLQAAVINEGEITGLIYGDNSPQMDEYRRNVALIDKRHAGLMMNLEKVGKELWINIIQKKDLPIFSRRIENILPEFISTNDILKTIDEFEE